MATETDQLTIESGHVSDLSDQDILIQYCLQNKVNKVAVDELLKRGFDSLEALKLVAMEDLSSQNIPMGQRRLIHHIAQALKSDDATSGLSGNTPSMTSAGNTGVPHNTSGNTSETSGSATITDGSTGASYANQPAAQQTTFGPQGVSQDFYNQALLGTLLNQQSQAANSANLNVLGAGTLSANLSANNNSANIQGPQPLLSDPQVHI